MIVIGVTGGIGTGKSEVSRFLESLGAFLIDADRVGHSVYLPDTQGWKELVAAFGRDILQPNREVDRRKLGGIVFSDPKALEKLNAITHPKIRQRISEIIQEQRVKEAKAVVVEAAILIEAGWKDLVDEVWVTTTDADKVVQRLQQRNNLTEEQIRGRINAQMTQAERLNHADVVLQNNGDLERLHTRLRELWGARVAWKGLG
ncbi:MAG: dephospho-CoA kinase [Dehalococcoidia bacterium]|nr:dephospho-CoA kinase [Dehalococcoidia bacterium]